MHSEYAEKKAPVEATAERNGAWLQAEIDSGICDRDCVTSGRIGQVGTVVTEIFCGTATAPIS